MAPLAILGRRRRPGRPYRGDVNDVDDNNRLIQAARPVLDRLEQELFGARMSVILTDAQAWVLDRRAGEASLQERHRVHQPGPALQRQDREPGELRPRLAGDEFHDPHLRARPGLAAVVDRAQPTVSRLTVTSQVSVNDDGGEGVGLVTRRDHRAMNLILLAAALLLVGGWIWQATAFKPKIPQQVNRFRIESAAVPATFAAATMDKIVYDRKAQTLTMNVQAVNQGKSGMDLRAVHFANLTFLPGTGAGGAVAGADGTYTISPEASIAAGATQPLTLTIRGRALTTNDLIPSGTANSNITSVLEFADSSNNTNFITAHQFLTPIFD